MKEKVLFKSEEKTSREEASEKIRKIAEKVSNSEMELKSGSESVEIQIPENLEFEIKVEEEGTEKSLEIEVEWDEIEGSESSEVSIT